MYIDDTGDFGGGRGYENRRVQLRSLAAVHPTSMILKSDPSVSVSSVRGAIV